MAAPPKKREIQPGPLQDPFYVVKEEVMQSMQGINALFDRWKELLNNTNTASNEEFKWTTDELKGGLKTIEYDLADLEDTVTVVENNRTKFKIDENEIATRKAFILQTKQKTISIKDELSSTRTKGKMDKDQRDMLTQKKAGVPDRYAKLQEAVEADNDEFIQNQHQRQQQIVRKQDQKVEVLHDTVNTLKQMGNQMDQVIKEQEILIEEVDQDVTRIDSGLRGAIQRVNKLIDSTKDSTQWCIIAFLFLVLIGLVILVFMLPGKSKENETPAGTTGTTTG
eukprot:TRINITY_DN4069_c0_g1_i1.p1 TRINITY_DN4069_c0_g1~~TRINITY_DN4069_c0_g1_i1.p1  ORF type:complete len:281 (-),score=54.60 TRINITY_DN4069_c0_g1_i1:28-870(-)